MGCVNALKGATSISTRLRSLTGQIMILCQCPERGDLHFYGGEIMDEHESIGVVSMP